MIIKKCSIKKILNSIGIYFYFQNHILEDITQIRNLGEMKMN